MTALKQALRKEKSAKCRRKTVTSGAIIGAMIGSDVPVVGTLVGGVAGAAIGGTVGAGDPPLYPLPRPSGVFYIFTPPEYHHRHSILLQKHKGSIEKYTLNR